MGTRRLKLYVLLATAVLLLAATDVPAQQSTQNRLAHPELEDRMASFQHQDNIIRPDAGSITYMQWMIVATGESVPNAVPVSAPAYGDTTGSCTYSQSALSLLPCWNPLRIEFDVVLPANFTLSSNSASPSTLPIASLGGSNPSNLLVTTNSIDSLDGGVTSLTATAYCSGWQVVVAVTVTNEDGSVFKFTNGQATNIPCALAGTIGGSLSSSTTGDTGSFTLTSQYIISGSYVGNFGDNGSIFGFSGNSTFTSTVNTDFTASGTVSIAAGQLCGAQTSALTLSSTGALAQANGVQPGIVGISVGDTLELAASNASTLIWFVASDENTLGNTLGSTTIFVTGYVVSGVCAGTFFYDAPFHTPSARIHPPPRLRHYPALLHPQFRLVFRDR